MNIDPSSASGRSTRGTFNLDDDPTIIGGIRIRTRDNAHGGGLSNTDMTRTVRDYTSAAVRVCTFVNFVKMAKARQRDQRSINQCKISGMNQM